MLYLSPYIAYPTYSKTLSPKASSYPRLQQPWTHGDTFTYQSKHSLLRFGQSSAEELETIRKNVSKIANERAIVYAQEEARIRAIMKRLFEGKNRVITVHTKTAFSIAHKLAKKLSRMEQDGVSLTAEEVDALIGDAIGTRIVLAKGDRNDVDQLVKQLVSAIEQGHLQVVELHNYTAPPLDAKGITRPYFQPKHIQAILDAHQQASERHRLFDNDCCITTEKVSIDDETGIRTKEAVPLDETYQYQIRDYGYTAAHLNVIYLEPKTHHFIATGEIQIRGRKTDTLANVEHLLYDMRRGKTKPEDFQDAPLDIYSRLQRLETTIGHLPDDKPDSDRPCDQEIHPFYAYIRDLFIQKRAEEMERSWFRIRKPKFVRKRQWASIEEISKLEQDIDNYRREQEKTGSH